MLNKKEFIRNRPFDELDAINMQDNIEASIINTVRINTGFGVIEGLKVSPVSNFVVGVNIGSCYDSTGNFLEINQLELIQLNAPNINNRIDIVTIKAKIIKIDNVDTTNKYDLGTDLVYSRDLLVSYELKSYSGVPSVTPIRPSFPQDELELAEITVVSSTTEILQSNIKDTRKNIKTYYLDIKDGTTAERPTAPNISQMYFDTTLKNMIVFNGTSWDVMENTVGSQNKVNEHKNNKANPHEVTKTQVGLSNVDNIQQATKTEFNTHTSNLSIHVNSGDKNNWNSAVTKINTHDASRANPHAVTKTQVGLGSVDDVKQATKVEFDTHTSNNDIHTSLSEKNSWNGKETVAGSQAKANKALTDSNLYTDTEIAIVKDIINNKNTFNDGIIIGNYKLSVNVSTGNLEITVITP